MNGGDNGAMVKIQELEDNLNSLQSYCESMNSAIEAGFNCVGAAMASNVALGAQTLKLQMASHQITLNSMNHYDVNH